MMKKRFFTLLFLLAAFAGGVCAQAFKVSGLRCEHLKNPIGLDVREPRFSWMTEAPGVRGWRQGAYQLQVATDAAFTRKNLVWDSGKRNSDASVLQAYSGPALRSATRYFWRVKAWDAAGMESAWSEPAFWESALLDRSDWKARWIEPEQEAAPVRYSAAHHLRKVFAAPKKIASARAYATAHGFYELYINGKKVGDQVLAPGWTSYQKRLQYQTYDISGLLRPGANAVGALVGEGWFRSGLGWEFQWGYYGKKKAFLCQIHLRYTDGSEQWISTDASWKVSSDGPIGKNEIYYGEEYDARRELPGWSEPTFDDSKWQNALPADYPMDNLLASNSVPVRKIQEIKPVKIFTTPEGDLVADMGQNMVGWVRLRVQGQSGQTVTLRHAEVLDKAGNFYILNLRAAKQVAKYTLRGGGEEVYEPRFSFYGFRYVAIEGYPGTLRPEDLTGIVVHSDMEPTGSFECSNPLVNQLQHNIVWGQKGNFVDVPTDCPQRDERLGWTGDAQVFAPTAAFNANVAPFFTKWLADVAADQRRDGAIPFVIPDVLNKPDAPNVGVSAGWGDAAVIIPWDLYRIYDDRRLLERQYPSMKAYVDYIRSKAGASLLWKGGSVFGDWLFFHPNTQGVNSHTDGDGFTNHDYISTAFFAHSADIVSRAADVLGKTEDARFYKNLFGEIKTVFQREFVAPSGRTVSESQTSYVLALHFNLLPDNLRPAAVKNLVDDIRARRDHLSTGFLGTPYLCHVLSDNGHSDVAYDLLLQESWPSWLYPVRMGATTIWERWDGQKPDSTFQDIGMNSFNHYAYGAIGDWMYQVAAGLRMGSNGYKNILIQPAFGKRLDHAKASYQSSYGEIASGWERKEGRTTLRVLVPANTTALLRLPVAGADMLKESAAPVSAAPGVQVKGRSGEFLELELGSGSYVFEF